MMTARLVYIMCRGITARVSDRMLRHSMRLQLMHIHCLFEQP